MNLAGKQMGKLYLLTALLMLLAGLLFGALASQSYIIPGFGKGSLGFMALRPMHVSAVMFWILLGASGCVYIGLNELAVTSFSNRLALAQWFFWLLAIVGIFYAYLNNDFGGREYWEFNPLYALPLATAWLLFSVNFIKVAKTIGNWPVYLWMWMTGLFFFLFTFTENYLWLFPYFRAHFISDMAIQWKANGSLVGSWNQLLYGTAFFLMERISKNKESGRSKTAFAMYFLGLSNLMFNWGHHIYTLPTTPYIRYIAYLVSMTEWVFFIRIVYLWKQSVSEAQKHSHYFPYRFLLMADVWAAFNLLQAIMMSVPAFNLYTHGTHVTVAHAMGTTIGINTMILLACCFEFLGDGSRTTKAVSKWVTYSFWMTQISLLVFWVSLNIAGIKRGIWQMSTQQESFAEMMQGLRGWFISFMVSGTVLMGSLGILAFNLIRVEVLHLIKSKNQERKIRIN